MTKYTAQGEFDLETQPAPEKNVKKTTALSKDWNSNAVVVKSNDKSFLE